MIIFFRFPKNLMGQTPKLHYTSLQTTTLSPILEVSEAGET